MPSAATLRRFVIALAFAALFIPLYVSDSLFFPFITGKNFAFRIIVEFMVAAWAVLALMEPAYRPKRTKMLAALGGFLAVVALADLFGENFYRSFWSNYERMEGLVGHIHLFAYFVVMTSVFKTERLWERFFQTSLGVSVLVALYGVGQLLGIFAIHQGGVRLDATLGNSTYLAVYMLFQVFLAAWFLLSHAKTRNMRLVYGAILLLDLFILFYTATRGAILGMVGGALVSGAFLLWWHRDDKKIRRFAIGAIAFAVLAVGGVYAARDVAWVEQHPVLGRFASISLDETTTKSRFLIWNMSFEAFKEHPVLGWGQENYILAFEKYYDPRMYAQEPWFDRSHNIFFDWLIAGGILGLLAYLSMYAITLYYLLCRGSTFTPAEKSVFLGLLAAYFFQNIFVFDNFASYLLFFSLLAYWTWRAEGSGVPSSAAVSPRAARIYVPAVAAALVLALYFVNVKPIMAGTALIQALTPHQEGLQKNLDYFSKVFAYRTFGSGEAREQLLQAGLRVQTLPADDSLKLAYLTAARGGMLEQIAAAPRDARYPFFLASFFNRIGAYDEALKYAQAARTLSPKKQPILFEIGTAYLRKGEIAKALQVFKEAYELEPSFEEARVAYGVAALFARQDSLARELLIPVFGSITPTDDRIIEAYAARGDLGTAISILRARVEAEPTNANYRIALASGYLRAGNRTAAVYELRKAIELSPSFKAQGEYYIKEIEAGRNP